MDDARRGAIDKAAALVRNTLGALPEGPLRLDRAVYEELPFGDDSRRMYRVTLDVEWRADPGGAGDSRRPDQINA